LVLLLDAWADGRRWHETGPGHDRHANPLQASAVSIANHMLEERLQAVMLAGEGFDDLNAAERHKVRIQIKKLRYASEFFASLYRRRAVEPFLAAMKTLQGDLGLRNDIEVARGLLKKVLKASEGGKVKTQLAYGAGTVVGWHSHFSSNAEKRLVAEWHRFAERQPYWDRPAPMPREDPAAVAAVPDTIPPAAVADAEPVPAAIGALVPPHEAAAVRERAVR
jgi:hypothetical protein